MALRKKLNNKTKINQKTMIHRGEFEDKLNKELLKIVHYNLQTSIHSSLFSKDVKVEQSFKSLGSLFHKLAALNIYECCLYVLFNSGQRPSACFAG